MVIKRGRANLGSGKLSSLGKVYLKPRLYLPPSDPHKLSGWELLKIAKEEGLFLTVEEKRKGETLESLAARMLMNRRGDTFKKNTSSFFVHLYREIFKGIISEKNRMPLFENYEEFDEFGPAFFPDIIFNGLKKTTYVEVKAVSNRNKRPLFGNRQIAGYLFSVLENKGSEALTGVFFYGGSRHERLYECGNEDGHICDNRCLVERLGHSLTDLLIIPHNLLVCLLMLARSFEFDQATSQSTINREIYRRPHKNWTNFLLRSQEASQAIDNIFQHVIEKRGENKKISSYRSGLWPPGFSEDDFYLRDLQLKKYESPENLHCISSRGFPIYKIRKFSISEYQNPPDVHSQWIGNLNRRLDDFLDGLWIHEEYYGIRKRELARKEKLAERAAIQMVDFAKVPQKPDDGIPI